jgi:hypothetical protein
MEKMIEDEGLREEPLVICTGCQMTKPESEFYFWRGKRHGRKCKSCRIQYDSDKNRVRREFVCDFCETTYVRNVRKDPTGARPHMFCSRTCKQRARRYRQHGLTGDEFRALGDSCAICGTTENLVIDHDHATGAVRGILCGFCNSGLGYFRDHPDLFDRAKAYLAG